MIKREWFMKSKIATYFATTKNAYLEFKKGSDHYTDNYITIQDI